VRPRAALFVWRVREWCTRRVVEKPFTAQTWRLVWENRAHGVDVGEEAARAPQACFLRLVLWAFSQTKFYVSITGMRVSNSICPQKNRLPQTRQSHFYVALRTPRTARGELPPKPAVLPAAIPVW